MRKILFFMLLGSSSAFAQQENPKPLRSSIETETRVIRQDVPMTNSIRKAFEEGSRLLWIQVLRQSLGRRKS